MDISRLRLQVLRMARERSALENRLIKHERLIKGSLTRLRVRCGKAGCRCQKSGKWRHGPLFYLSVHVRGKHRMVYIRKPFVEKTRYLVEQGRSFRGARNRWWKIQQQMWKIFMRMEKMKDQGWAGESKEKGF